MDESYGVCPVCMKSRTGFAWCSSKCPGRFLKEGKTSGNAEIDKLIYEVQLKTGLEWIPYDRFQDIQDINIGEGGFTDSFSATWLDGLNGETDVVVLKQIKDSNNMNNMTNVFINEVNECILSGSQFCGITKDPQTEEFMMVLNYGICTDCSQPYTSEEKWCNNCDTKRFVEGDERGKYGICPDCSQMMTGDCFCINCYNRIVDNKGPYDNGVVYGKCDECKQPYTTKEEWCNNCDTKRFFEENILDELSEDERRQFKKYGICTDCLQIKTSGEWCNCDTKRLLGYGGYHKKLDELSEDERRQFKNYGICTYCLQIRTSVEWCNCDTKRFLEYSGYHKKLDELSEDERKRFKKYGICSVCLQIKSSEEWCNNCDTERFLEESETIGYCKKLDELSEDERWRYKQYGICPYCLQIKKSRFCDGCCFECYRPYTSKERWCNNCDTPQFSPVFFKKFSNLLPNLYNK